MPVTLSIVESTTELNTVVTEVILESASTPGPPGVGVPAGGTTGQTLVKASDTDYDTEWDDAVGGGADDQTAAEVPFTPAGGLAATDVQAALEELDAEKQASDSDLTAIAALTTTAFGRGLLELANAAALLSAAGAQAADADLTAIAALSPSNDDVIQRKAGAWTNRPLAQLLTDLAALGTTFQPLDSDLTSIAALTTTSFGRGLLELANQAALLAAAGAAAASHTHSAADVTSGTLALARGGTGASLADPDADRILFWDDSAGAVTFLSLSGLAITDTTLGFSADMATQAELDAHINDAADAHDASAISADSTTLSGTGTDVQAVLEELDNLLDDHSSRHENGGADEISIAGLDGTPTELTNHLNDTSAAHAASAISADSSTLVGTGTDVQAVLEELDNSIADHLADSSDAHDASAISVLDTNGDYTATDVEGVLAEIAPLLGGTAGHADDGWVDDTATTWTYASATTFTIAGVDETAKFSKGTRIKLTQTTVKYFVVIASSFSTNTTVTVTGGTDYSLANAAISNNYYSYAVNPEGYPGWFNYTPTYTGFGTDPALGGGYIQFQVVGRSCCYVHIPFTNGVSNATGFTITLPITAALTLVGQGGRCMNNSALTTTPCMVSISGGSATATIQRDYSGATWTASNNKNAQFTVWFHI